MIRKVRMSALGLILQQRQGLWRPQFLSPTWLNNFPFPSSAPLTLLSSLSLSVDRKDVRQACSRFPLFGATVPINLGRSYSGRVVRNDRPHKRQILVPTNEMTFPGIKAAQQRADLLAFLKEATKKGAGQTAQGPMGARWVEWGGMMGGGQVPNLKKLYSAQRVQAITYCKDTYIVTTANGQSRSATSV